jgi:small-conductance mechanosensitive channel
VQLAHSVNPQDATARLKGALAAIQNVQKSPPPDVAIVDFNERGPVLAVRPYTHTDDYWQVYFDPNRVIAETFGSAGYPVPEARRNIRQKAARRASPISQPASRRRSGGPCRHPSWCSSRNPNRHAGRGRA